MGTQIFQHRVEFLFSLKKKRKFYAHIIGFLTMITFSLKMQCQPNLEV